MACSPADESIPGETNQLRGLLEEWAGEFLGRAAGGIGLDRIGLLETLLGARICRKLGIYRLPDDFVLSVVIPVFNEAPTIERVVQRVRSTGLPLEIILVDDGSTDGSSEVLARLREEQSDLIVSIHASNQGKGSALRTGLEVATGDVVVIQDADMEYDPQDFHLLLQPIVEGRADVVYGSRYANHDRAVSPFWHQAANQLITLLTGLCTGRRFTDVETCYKMFRRDLIRSITPTLRERRFGIEIELTAKLCRLPGVRFHERPINYDRRWYAEGKKIGWRDGLWALWCIARYCFEPNRISAKPNSINARESKRG